MNDLVVASFDGEVKPSATEFVVTVEIYIEFYESIDALFRVSRVGRDLMGHSEHGMKLGEHVG